MSPDAASRHEHPLVLVVSDELELDYALPRGTRCVRVSPAKAHEDTGAWAMLVLDARCYPPSALIEVRRAAASTRTLVVVVAERDDDPALSVLDADEVLTAPLRPLGERRLRRILELGEARTHAGTRRYESGTFPFVVPEDSLEDDAEFDRRRFEHLAAMGTMVAGFAHEIRNPMASLRSIAESLNEELIEAGLHLPHVRRMLTVVERVERLVRTSLLFGRPSPPRRGPHAPAAIVSAAIAAMLARTGAMREEVGVEVEADLPDVYVDDGQLVQVLVILLNNAVDATGSPRRVLVRAERFVPKVEPRRGSEPPSHDVVRFDVRDDGPGIAPEIMGRIFDPFFTTRAAGTGLGLSIAQQLAVDNGARIAVTSSAGGATTFSVLVPLALPPPSR